MANSMRIGFGATIVALLAAGCDTAPPGGGLTNGPPPSVLSAEEKPAVRDDLREPDASGDNALADQAATSPASTGTNAGTAGQGGQQPGRPTATEKPGHGSGGSSRSGAPPKKEASGENGAQGAAKPAGNINVGNPRGPQ